MNTNLQLRRRSWCSLALWVTEGEEGPHQRCLVGFCFSCFFLSSSLFEVFRSARPASEAAAGYSWWCASSPSVKKPPPSVPEPPPMSTSPRSHFPEMTLKTKKKKSWRGIEEVDSQHISLLAPFWVLSRLIRRKRGALSSFSPPELADGRPSGFFLSFPITRRRPWGWGGFISAVDLISTHLSRFSAHVQYVCIRAASDAQEGGRGVSKKRLCVNMKHASR